MVIGKVNRINLYEDHTDHVRESASDFIRKEVRAVRGYDSIIKGLQETVKYVKANWLM